MNELDLEKVDCKQYGPAAYITGLLKSNLEAHGIYTKRPQVRNVLRSCKYFDAITYGHQLDAFGKRARRVVLGLPAGQEPTGPHLRHLHAKVYLLYNTRDECYKVLVGSMNLTYTDMVDCLVEITQANRIRMFQQLFEHLWEQQNKINS